MSENELSPEMIAEIEAALSPGLGMHHLSHFVHLLVEVPVVLGEAALSNALRKEFNDLPLLYADDESASAIVSEWVATTAPMLRELLQTKGVKQIYPLVYLPCCRKTARTFFTDRDTDS